MKLSLPFTKKVLSLDIGAYEVKAVEGRMKGQGVKIDNYFTIPVPAAVYDDGNIVDMELLHHTLAKGLKENKAKATKTHITINNSSIITREVLIPKVEDDAIDDVLRFQLEDYIPIDPDDYVIQFEIVEEFFEDDVEKLNILVVAIPKDMVKEHFELLQNLDLNPVILDYQPNSISKLIRYGGVLNGEYSTQDMTLAIVDMGHDNTKISIIRDGSIQVSRIIDNRGKDVEAATTDADIMENFIEDLNQKIELVFRYFLSRRSGNRIDMILLTGGNSNIDGIEELFLRDFNIATTKIESFDNIDEIDQLHLYINAIGSIIRIAEV
ncbi:MAG: pilus assembly protein PilM [Tissierellia bacterium]|nr:pilus assembly protein PilM [Tissierellia bacterium]